MEKRYKPYIVLACGSRKYDDRDTINKVLDSLYAKIGPRMMLLCGGAVGADELARQWAHSRKCDHVVIYAKWDTEGRGAGPIRNGRMASWKPKRIVAFMIHGQNENRGTQNMIDLANDRGIKVKRYW